MSPVLFMWFVLISYTHSEPSFKICENIDWNDEVDCEGQEILCASDTKCELQCHGNCSNAIINATHSTSLQLDCTEQSRCDGLVIYAPNTSNIQIHTASIHSLQIYSVNGFKSTNLTFTSSISSTTIIGQMYCGDDWSHSCNISVGTAKRGHCVMQHNNLHVCSNPAATTAPSAPHSNYREVDSGAVLGYIAIAVIVLLCGLCATMYIIYQKTKEQYSGQLKPASYDYDRQRTIDTMDTTTVTTTTVTPVGSKVTRNSKSDADNQDHRKQRFISLSRSNNPADPMMFGGVGSRSGSTVDVQAGSYAINRGLAHISRESFTTTKEMWLDSNGQLEMAETQKEKFSLSLQPISALKEDEHAQDDFDYRSSEKNGEEPKDEVKTPVSELETRPELDVDHDARDQELEDKGNEKDAAGYTSWATPTESEIEMDAVMNSRYSAMQKKGAGHMVVVTESEVLSLEQAARDHGKSTSEAQQSNEDDMEQIPETLENHAEVMKQEDKTENI